MSYRLGHCPQTGEKIAVQDINGAWSSKKKNWRQADLIFSNGSRVRTIISQQALDSPDFVVLINAITAPNSEACNDQQTIDVIKTWGTPVDIKDVTRK